ncbi:MAG TPA: flagellar hook-basal body complex protein FliE [Bryobacteraceae bacterium]|nr:flagellar hook-basal body complex protein FliE [Bryobacteraceae bacterium]
MTAPIAPIVSPARIAGIAPPSQPAPSASAGDAFGSILSDAIHKVDGLRKGSDEAIDKLLSGEGGELHDVALAVQKAELSFEMFVQVRNKVVSAYQEVMRMQM